MRICAVWKGGGLRRVPSAAALSACTVAAVACAGASPARAGTPLPHYDITARYVAGLSSGAAEAVQFQVAYSHYAQKSGAQMSAVMAMIHASGG